MPDARPIPAQSDDWLFVSDFLLPRLGFLPLSIDPSILSSYASRIGSSSLSTIVDKGIVVITKHNNSNYDA